MTAARRLAAILAADVVGYSRLMGEDEAGTAKAVRERREAAAPIVAAHGGRIVKTSGDGALIEFPSIVAAIECAIHMQKRMAERNEGVPAARRILYRMGVNLGDVLIEGEDILGDGVNIAARLEGICEPGGVCLSGAAYEQVRDRVRETFVDLGEQALKNIARPIRAYAVRLDTVTPTRAEGAMSGPPRLSIVVLPFANSGGDANQDYFVDGVTESLTTDLSRMRGMLVIGRNTAMTYKGKAVDLRELGRELNVRYVLEGSVQRGGNRMRVNVQLIEAETGVHLWAERFERPLADLFDLHDEIVARIANTLNVQLIGAEARRAERAPNPDSMDLYFQGMSRLSRGLAPETFAQARALFERALSLDPHNVEALVGLALADAEDVAVFVGDDRAQRLASAEAAANKALSLAPDHPIAHVCMGIVLSYSNRADQGIAECEQALALDRNLAGAHAVIGLAKAFAGRAEETEAHIEEAIRLSPRDRRVFGWLGTVGYAKICVGLNEEAALWWRRSVEASRNYPIGQFWLAGVLGALDKLDEARAAAQAGLALDPKFTIARLRTHAVKDNPIYHARRKLIRDGMRKAGVPER